MMKEHRSLLASAEKLEGEAAKGQALDDFLALLAEHCKKEESVLFPAITSAIDGGREALEILEVEHARVRELKEELENLRSDPNADPARLAEAVASMREVLPPHIFKEDNILYPMASRVIPAEELVVLRARAGIDELR